MRNFPDRPIGCRLFNTKGCARPISCGTCFSNAIGAPASSPCRWCAVAALRQKTPPYPNRPEGPRFGVLASARPVWDAERPPRRFATGIRVVGKLLRPPSPSRSVKGKRKAGLPGNGAPRWLTASPAHGIVRFTAAHRADPFERRLPVFGRNPGSVVAGDASSGGRPAPSATMRPGRGSAPAGFSRVRCRSARGLRLAALPGTARAQLGHIHDQDQKRK